MDPVRRPLFNAHAEEIFARFAARLEKEVGTTPFRTAETPLMLTAELRDRLARHATEIIGQLSSAPLLARMKGAVPARYDVPGMDALPSCAQVDFALVDDGHGGLDGRVVELQGFPSLYGLMPVMAEAWAGALADVPGLDHAWSWAIGRSRVEALELIRETLLNGHDPSEVVLVDLDPDTQKTRPDFVATRMLFGIEAVCATKLVRRERTLWRKRDGKLLSVRRIFNRVVFDELEKKAVRLGFDWTEPLDVEWCPHPNWYWVWSKYSLPLLDHPAVPKTRYLDEIADPGDLASRVLKPLFSFAGGGVVVDVTPEALAAVPADQRHGWVLQDKVAYANAIRMPDGGGVKAEVRIMLVRPERAATLEPVIALVRLSRGKMLGVDFNRNLTWVGASVGIWPE